MKRMVIILLVGLLLGTSLFAIQRKGRTLYYTGFRDGTKAALAVSNGMSVEEATELYDKYDGFSRDHQIEK